MKDITKGYARADAEEGDKNEQISDADSKMDAVLDAIKDACSKMDAAGQRMDAMEENFRRMDARMDSIADASKKDEDEKEEDKKADAMADEAPITRAEAARLRADLASLQARAPALISDADREKLANIQADADPVFQAFNDRAPAPLEGEAPIAYKRRLAAKMQPHSDKWKSARLSAIADEAVLDTVIADVYADSMVAARRGVDVPAGQLRMITRQAGGHTINEFEGSPGAWVNQFAGHSQRATGDWRRPH